MKMSWKRFDIRNALFLALTFLITYACWLPLALRRDIRPNTALFLALHLCGGSGPTLAPFLVMVLIDRDAIAAYCGRLLRWKVGVVWYFAIIAAAALPCVALVLLDSGQAYELRPVATMIRLFPLMILGGGLEEFGWRTYFLEIRLRAPRSLLSSTILLGAVWALWHLPLFGIEGMVQRGRNFPLFALSIFGISFLLTAAYSATRSGFLAIFAHTVINFSYNIGFMPPAGDLRGQTIQSVSYFVVGAAAFALLKSKGRAGRESPP